MAVKPNYTQKQVENHQREEAPWCLLFQICKPALETRFLSIFAA